MKNHIKSRNHAAVNALIKLGFCLPDIRRSLPKLTGIKHQELADRLDVSRPTITATIDGKRRSSDIQCGIADVFEVPADVLFDERSSADTCGVCRNGSDPGACRAA